MIQDMSVLVDIHVVDDLSYNRRKGHFVVSVSLATATHHDGCIRSCRH